MKRQLNLLLITLILTLTACAHGYYYSPYGYRPSYGSGYRSPVYGSYGYPRAYPNYELHEHRDFHLEGGRGWGGNGRAERHEWREHHEGGEGHAWEGRHEHG